LISIIIGALVIGLLTIFALVIGQGVVEGQSTAGWPSVLSSILNNVTPIIGVVGIVAMFIVVVKAACGLGGGGL
jgi:tetrahydromethanopterin S-methyltransferase subunit E